MHLLMRKMQFAVLPTGFGKSLIYIAHFVALIGCRAIQLHPETFWSAPITNFPWKSKMN